MAVYKKSYKRYEGRLTAGWSRFLVVPRYAFEEMHRSRFLSLFFLGTLLPPLVFALLLYVNHNVSALELLRTKGFEIRSGFFMNFLGTQCMFAYFLAAFIGPGQVSPDLANNGLPLYLARPFSRGEYILGKLSVLLILLSVMTWIPGLLLFGLQGYLEGTAWVTSNMRVAYGLFFGAWIWILVLSLLSLALSAWVKWKPVAGMLMFGVFFVAAGFGGAINGMLHTKWGHLLNISNLMGTVWVTMFDEPLQRGNGAAFFRIVAGENIPTWCCWLSLVSICGLCLYLLAKKVRGVEVVK